MIEHEKLIPDSEKRSKATLVETPANFTGPPVDAFQGGVFIRVPVDTVEEVVNQDGPVELVAQVFIFPEGLHLSGIDLKQGATLVVAGRNEYLILSHYGICLLYTSPSPRDS